MRHAASLPKIGGTENLGHGQVGEHRRGCWLELTEAAFSPFAVSSDGRHGHEKEQWSGVEKTTAHEASATAAHETARACVPCGHQPENSQSKLQARSINFQETLELRLPQFMEDRVWEYSLMH